MAKLSPIGNNAQFINGIPANGAKLFFYAAGSSTKQTTYTDEAGLTPQSNPIILDSRGEPSQPIWLTEGLNYKIVFASSTDSDPPMSPIWDIDDVSGINDASVSLDQWVNSGVIPTYVSATQFTLPGDQTSSFTVGRRIKVLVTAGTAYGTISASVFGALTTVTALMDSLPLDTGLSSVQLGLITPNNGSLPFDLSAGAIQKQTYTAYTTAGSSSVFTLTPTPALSTLSTNARFNITFDEAPTGSPTLQVSGLTAKNIKYYDALGVKQFVTSSVVPLNWTTDIIYDGTDWMVQKILPALVTYELQSLTAVANTPANGVTITIPAGNYDFRSTTLNNGNAVSRTLTSPATLVISSGSTLGAVSNVASRIYVGLIDNAGTLEAFAINAAGTAIANLDETELITTVAEGGAGGADSVSTFYSTNARASVAFRVLGFYAETQTTAGTHSAALTKVQGIGGNAVVSLSSLGASQLWINLTGSRAMDTNYTNTSGRAIMAAITFNVSSTIVGAIRVGGLDVARSQGGAAAATTDCITVIIPPGEVYSARSLAGAATISTWYELR